MSSVEKVTSSVKSDEKSWYLVRCKSKQELRAKLNLTNQSITAYYPTVDVLKEVRGKRQLKEEALFPGYIFVHLDITSILASKVNNTFGVYGFVKFSGRPQMVPDELIKAFETIEKQTIDLTLKSGDEVMITGGNYEHMTAIFLAEESEQRSILLIELLNQKVQLSVDNIYIAPTVKPIKK